MQNTQDCKVLICSHILQFCMRKIICHYYGGIWTHAAKHSALIWKRMRYGSSDQNSSPPPPQPKAISFSNFSYAQACGHHERLVISFIITAVLLAVIQFFLQPGPGMQCLLPTAVEIALRLESKKINKRNREITNSNSLCWVRCDAKFCLFQLTPETKRNDSPLAVKQMDKDILLAESLVYYSLLCSILIEYFYFSDCMKAIWFIRF